jgi:pantoate--beta-alanine ligase
VEVIERAADFRKATDAARAGGRTVGFVPTMGFFHLGHLSLMERARAERDVVAISIFVNPLQFGPSEDLATYPRDLDRDLALAEDTGVDLAFVPSVEEMYPGGRPEVTIDPGPLGDRLEGASRPGHFRGMATVVAKLFNLVGPCAAYFGEKDAQQLAVVRRMVRDLSMPVEVVGCPTVRESDGLAMSSRNVYLSPEERRAATCLFQALREARESTDPYALRVAGRIADRIAAEPLARPDYVAVVDDETFEDVDRIERHARAVVAARFGRARLIDNVLLRPPVGQNEAGAG